MKCLNYKQIARTNRFKHSFVCFSLSNFQSEWLCDCNPALGLQYVNKVIWFELNWYDYSHLRFGLSTTDTRHIKRCMLLTMQIFLSSSNVSGHCPFLLHFYLNYWLHDELAPHWRFVLSDLKLDKTKMFLLPVSVSVDKWTVATSKLCMICRGLILT